MNILNTKAGAVAVGVLLIGGGLYWATKKAAGAAAEVAQTKLNPASDENLIYQMVNGIGDNIDGGERDSFDLGRWLYRVTH